MPKKILDYLYEFFTSQLFKSIQWSNLSIFSFPCTSKFNHFPVLILFHLRLYFHPSPPTTTTICPCDTPPAQTLASPPRLGQSIPSCSPSSRNHSCCPSPNRKNLQLLQECVAATQRICRTKELWSILWLSGLPF